MNKMPIFFIVVCLFLITSCFCGFTSFAHATMPGFEEPRWYSVDVEMSRPSKPGGEGVLKFIFIPLIDREFDLNVRLNIDSDVKVSGAKETSIKAYPKKKAVAEFKFIAGNYGMRSGAFEFSTVYPAKELSAIAVSKYGAAIPESKNLLEKIKGREAAYSSSISFSLFSSPCETSVNPEVCFSKIDESGFLLFAGDAGVRDSQKIMERFEAQYADALASTDAEFTEFINETGADFASDLARYLDVRETMVPSSGNAVKMLEIRPEMVFKKINLFFNSKKRPKNQNNEYNYSERKKNVISIVSFFNRSYIDEFKKTKNIKTLSAYVKLIEETGRLDVDKKLKPALNGYLYYNAGIMAKALGRKDHANYFKRACSENVNLYLYAPEN